MDKKNVDDSSKKTHTERKRHKKKTRKNFFME